MDSASPLYGVAILLIALATTFILKKFVPRPPLSFRYESIEGLRGFLALSVFIHHAAIWQHFLQNGRWQAPTSNFYNLLGRVGVTLFFMITSFLFTGKLLNAQKAINWKDFFTSRIRRLVPMFYLALGIQMLLILIISKWQIIGGSKDFLKDIMHWMCFTYFKTPTINNYGFTSLMCAGVVWSLPFEWLFYCCMPLMYYLVIRGRVPAFYLMLSSLLIAIYCYLHPINFVGIYPFIGGALAPILRKHPIAEKWAHSRLASIGIIISLLALGFFHDTITAIPMALITIIFTLIALGNDLFGLLRSKTLSLLGDMGYSTYLLHGMLLFTVFYFGLGYEYAKTFSNLQCWMVIGALTPILIIISYLGYNYVELPFMQRKSSRVAKPISQKAKRAASVGG